MLKKIPPSIIYAIPFPVLFWIMIEIQHNVLAGARYIDGIGSNVHPLFPLLSSIGGFLHVRELLVLQMIPVVIFGGIIFFIANIFINQNNIHTHPFFWVHFRQSFFYYLLLFMIILLRVFDFHGLFLDTSISISIMAIITNIIFVLYKCNLVKTSI